MFEKTMIQYFRRDWKNRFLNSKVRHFDQLLKKSFSINAYYHLDIPAWKKSDPLDSGAIRSRIPWNGMELVLKITGTESYGPKWIENYWRTIHPNQEIAKGQNWSVLDLPLVLRNPCGIRALTVAIGPALKSRVLSPGTNIVGYNKPVACLHVAINDIKWVVSSPKIKTIANMNRSREIFNDFLQNPNFLNAGP